MVAPLVFGEVMEQEMYAKVIVDIASSNVDKVFDYLCPMPLRVGNEVLVPFGGRKISGIVIGLSHETDAPKDKLKSVLCVRDEGIPEHCVKMAEFVSRTYFVGMSDSLRLFLPRAVRGDDAHKTQLFVFLTDEKEAMHYLENSKRCSQNQAAAIKFLLENKTCPKKEFSKKFGQSATKTLQNAGFLGQKDCILERLPNFEIIENKVVTLNKWQQKVKDEVMRTTGKYLIHGVTGCGKTEVYLSLAEEVLKCGKNVLFLVPEISLTPQMVGIVRGRFGEKIAVLHSGLSQGERYDEWKRIQRGDARVVIGARSALFAPLSNVGLVVIDEEHDDSYRSDTNPRYDAREVAGFLASTACCSLVLGSATPSLDSYSKTLSGEYKLLEIPYRANGQKMPDVEIVDMTREFQNGNTGLLSHTLQDAISDALSKGEQIMLFQNRRGYNSFVQCKNCGWVATCPSCDVSLVYHKHENVLKCHFCGNRYKMFSVCPECKNENLVVGAPGTQKVVEEVEKLFPAARVLRMDNDTTRGKNGHAKILQEFKNKNADILVGTQMIAKGHDFPLVSVVGIVDADISLHQASYVASEKTFSLITQVAGRAGRANHEGRVILQTKSPRHYIYRFAKNYDYLAFFSKESNLREVTKYPPFSKILRILVKSSSPEVAKDVIMSYYEKVRKLQQKNKDDFYYLGVMRSPVAKIENQYRYQVLMRISKNSGLETQIYELVKDKPKNVVVFVETNPTNLS